MGPDKAYLVQHTDNTRIFWADKHELVLGACFKGKTGAVPRQLLNGVRQALASQPVFLMITSLLPSCASVHSCDCADGSSHGFTSHCKCVHPFPVTLTSLLALSAGQVWQAGRPRLPSNSDLAPRSVLSSALHPYGPAVLL